jgi:hypothetical protein
VAATSPGRLLLPGLARLLGVGRLPHDLAVVAIDREPADTAAFRERTAAALAGGGVDTGAADRAARVGSDEPRPSSVCPVTLALLLSLRGSERGHGRAHIRHVPEVRR